MQKKKAAIEAFAPYLKFTDAHNKDRVYEYHLTGCMVIGRISENCDIALVDEPTVSGRQCRLYTEDGKVYITDLGATNPTYLNNRKLEDDVPVRNGDVISFGRVDLYVEFRKDK